MLVKLNGIPIEALTHHMSNTAEILKNVVITPINFDVGVGVYHFTSPDLNPINAPQHIVEGFIHLPDKIASGFEFLANLL